MLLVWVLYIVESILGAELPSVWENITAHYFGAMK